MSLRANPTAIGLFIIGALTLIVAGVVSLASTAVFGDQHTFVSYFDESVNGLDRGAPVKFQGVPVGVVTGLLIRIDQEDKTFRVPIQYEIEINRLTTETGAFLQLDDRAVLGRQIAAGLRAQLQMESLVTGQLYVELTFRPEDDAPDLEVNTPYPEIPTIPSFLAAFGTEAGSLVSDALKILFRVNTMLAEIDVQGINTAVVASAQAVERLVGSDELVAAIGEFPEVAAQMGRTLAEMERTMERIGRSVDPLQTRAEATLDEMALALRAARNAIEGTRDMFTTDSGFGYNLDQALVSLREAAEALRMLAVSVERNPDILLRGYRPPGG
ncbi:MAG: MlaD family protein [Longimicrobiales bacterium]|nr:MlaD family protein [Longimicrobiales bacterium]